jgi:hypothetical protein
MIRIKLVTDLIDIVKTGNLMALKSLIDLEDFSEIDVEIGRIDFKKSVVIFIKFKPSVSIIHPFDYNSFNFIDIKYYFIRLLSFLNDRIHHISYLEKKERKDFLIAKRVDLDINELPNLDEKRLYDITIKIKNIHI